MTVRQQWGIVLGVVVVLAGVLFLGTHAMRDELFPVSVGGQAPDFKASPLLEPVYPAAPSDSFTSTPVADGARAKTLASYRGQVVLLNIWATWCAPCRAEMPSIEKLHREFGPRGLKIVAVSVDDPGQQAAVRDFARDLGLTFEILQDPTHDIQRAYQTTGVPETFVLGKDGVIRKKIIGATDWSSEGTRALVAQLLAEDAGR
ncbi:MAG: TlpA family protein disulfide reductase [Gemmatimonadaceae bacterium]|nr:TlpA family protein disulfide reductase [Gemmatimonadaceae bacterium]NUQ94654.1 TlpA family protein disulfide reductase [Gemmatimonadaceae bacterium]NUR20606.1 TlpA family protein disulfide reductase [Gemmatimonadaceae bacterium]NUS96614.1 TlpA family protein disulfide reductase [Gemmatimonadaceae bacterium]